MEMPARENLAKMYERGYVLMEMLNAKGIRLIDIQEDECVSIISLFLREIGFENRDEDE